MKGELRNYHGIVFETISDQPTRPKKNVWIWDNRPVFSGNSYWAGNYDIIKPVAIEPEGKKP